MGLLTDKVAVITGAGRGIGRATALLFAEHGASVVVNDLGTERDGTGSDVTPADQVVHAITRAGGRAVANYADVGTPNAADGLIDQAVQSFGGLDILVNIAGILIDKTLLKLSDEHYEAVVRTHQTGTFLCSRAAARVMQRQGRGGRIINTTSVAGMRGNFGQSNHAAAAAAVYGLTRTASIELQRHDILVNAVAPLAKTRVTEELPIFEKLESSMTPEHVAPAYLFFASGLSAGRTGHVLSVAGGKMSVFRIVESPGRFKEADNGVWTAEELAEHFDSIQKP